MKQEQLSLETCQEIGHLFHNSRYGWIVYEEPKDPTFPKQEPELYDYWEPRKPWCEFYTRLASHPSITDMMKWLWKKRLYIKPAIYDYDRGWEMESAIGALPGPIKFKAVSLIEAYAEAVKFVMKEIEK